MRRFLRESAARATRSAVHVRRRARRANRRDANGRTGAGRTAEGGISTRAVGTEAGEVRDDGDAGRETRRWTRD